MLGEVGVDGLVRDELLAEGIDIDTHPFEFTTRLRALGCRVLVSQLAVSPSGLRSRQRLASGRGVGGQQALVDIVSELAETHPLVVASSPLSLKLGRQRIKLAALDEAGKLVGPSGVVCGHS